MCDEKPIDVLKLVSEIISTTLSSGSKSRANKIDSLLYVVGFRECLHYWIAFSSKKSSRRKYRSSNLTIVFLFCLWTETENREKNIFNRRAWHIRKAKREEAGPTGKKISYFLFIETYYCKTRGIYQVTASRRCVFAYIFLWRVIELNDHSSTIIAVIEHWAIVFMFWFVQSSIFSFWLYSRV